MEILLGKSGYTTLIDDEDFEKINHYRWVLNDKRHKSVATSIRCSCGEGFKKLYLHRYLLGVNDSSLVVDHINGNPLDNRKANLRACSALENSRNRKKSKGKYKYKGVAKQGSTDRYLGYISFNGKRNYLGNFVTEEMAAMAYDCVAKIVYGEFANLNKPDKTYISFDYKLKRKLDKRNKLKESNITWCERDKCYIVQIKHNKKLHKINSIKTIEEAIKLRDELSAKVIKINEARV